MSPTRPGGLALRVSPADGQTGVRLDAAVVLAFSAPVARETVERNLHLMNERAIADSACPDSATMMHPDMEHCMADSAMMSHLDADHSTSGRFSWNAAGTVCTFQPDSMMAPATRHMIHVGREMMDMLGGGMGGMMDGGMMGGHGSGTMSGHMMLHFTTMDTSDGHSAHH